MGLLWCQLFNKACEIGFYQVSADFLFPALVLFLTIRCAVTLSKKEFKRAQKIEEEKENKINKQVIGVLKNSLDAVNREIPEVINVFEGRIDLNFDKLKRISRISLDASYLDSLIRLDIVTLANAIDNLGNNKDEFNLIEFVSDLNEVKSVYSLYTLEEQRFNDNLAFFYRFSTEGFIAVQSEIMRFADRNKSHLGENLSRLLEEIRIKARKADESINHSSLPLIYAFIEDICRELNVADNTGFIESRLFQISKDYVIKYKIMLIEMNTLSNFCRKKIQTLQNLLERLEKYRKLLD